MTDFPEADRLAERTDTATAKRVLVVDDAITVRLFCRKLLEDAGYAVEEAVNGLEGLERLLERDIDLIVVDINMTKMDGYEMLRAIRRDPGIRATPALMMSTESRTGDMERAYAAGANFYLFKPIKPDVFLECVRLMCGVTR